MLGVPDEIRERMGESPVWLSAEAAYGWSCGVDAALEAIARDRDALIAMLRAEQVGWEYADGNDDETYWFPYVDGYGNWIPEQPLVSPSRAVYRFTAQEDRPQ